MGVDEKYVGRVVKDRNDPNRFTKRPIVQAKGFGILETQRVPCPYEPVGYVSIEIKKFKDGSREVEDFDKIRKCAHCDRPIKLKAQMMITGIRYEDLTQDDRRRLG